MARDTRCLPFCSSPIFDLHPVLLGFYEIHFWLRQVRQRVRTHQLPLGWYCVFRQRYDGISVSILTVCPKFDGTKMFKLEKWLIQISFDSCQPWTLCSDECLGSQENDLLSFSVFEVRILTFFFIWKPKLHFFKIFIFSGSAQIKIQRGNIWRTIHR